MNEGLMLIYIFAVLVLIAILLLGLMIQRIENKK